MPTSILGRDRTSELSVVRLRSLLLWVALQWSCPVARAEPAAAVGAPQQTSRGTELAAVLPANSHAYQRLMSLGLREFYAGHWAEARAFFLRGHALSPSARSCRALGMTAFNLKRYPDALRELTCALNDPRRPLSPALREQSRELLDRASTFVGVVHVLLEPPHAELRVDGIVTKLELDGRLSFSLGEHLLEVEAPGHFLLRRTIVIDGSDGETLSLVLRPHARSALVVAADEARGLSARRAASHSVHAEARQPRSSMQRVFADYRWSWVVGASTLAAAGVATSLHFRALDEQRKVEARCPGTCDPWDGVTERRDNFNGWSRALFISSVVLAVGTAVALVLERQRVMEKAQKPGPGAKVTHEL